MNKYAAKMKKSIMIFLAGLVIILIIIGMSLCQTRYVNNYWKMLGLEQSFLYKDVIEAKGEPLSADIDIDDFKATAHYEGVDFVWYNKDFKGIFQRAEVTDPNLKLGNKRIGIGSSKDEVKAAYKHIQATRDYNFAYIDGNTWVEFILDENNKVQKIILAPFAD